MRLGAPVFVDNLNPESFALAHVEKGYGAAAINETFHAGDPENAKYLAELKKHNIIVGEVNMGMLNAMSLDPAERKKGIDHCKERLTLADELEAKGFVAIVGTYHPTWWAGPHPRNFTKEFIEDAVEVWTEITESVKPKHSKVEFEMVPFNFMDNMDACAEFISRLNPNYVGLHFDPCNYMTSMRNLMNNGDYIDEVFDKYSKDILTLHAKDISVNEKSCTIVMSETFIGEGRMDYDTFLRRLNQMDPDTPIFLEHYRSDEDYEKQRQCFLKAAEHAGVELVLPI